MNECLNCGKKCKNKFCSYDCYWNYFRKNKEYKKLFINKIKAGIKKYKQLLIFIKYGIINID